jgi:CO/xanthine dehydrogenase Mo-binding subunit
VFVTKDPTKRLTWSQVIPSQTSIVGIGTNISDHGATPLVLCCFVEVEVDTETGEVSAMDAVCATDVGLIVSPLDCAQQTVWGLVCDGTREAYVVDQTTGRVLNPNYLDLKSRSFADCPIIRPSSLNPRPNGRWAPKPIGEAVGIPFTPAVVMAVYNATGKMLSLPITPDKILTALGKV